MNDVINDLEEHGQFDKWCKEGMKCLLYATGGYTNMELLLLNASVAGRNKLNIGFPRSQLISD
jgi:hypothetical protein